MLELKCPICGSENVQNFELINSLGTTSVKETSIGGGIGLNTTGTAGGGIGISGTSGVHQTNLASRCKPPDEPKMVYPSAPLLLLYLLFGVASAIDFFSGGGWLYGLFALACFNFCGIGMWVNDVKYGKFNHLLKLRYFVDLIIYQSSYLCLRCGSDFVVGSTKHDLSEGHEEKQFTTTHRIIWWVSFLIPIGLFIIMV